MIRRRHIDMCLLKAFTILSQRGGKRTGTIQDAGKIARTVRHNVLNHKDRRREVWRELHHQLRECFNTSQRGPNNNNVMTRHAYPPSPLEADYLKMSVPVSK